jgi:hypothetical protein
MPRHRLTPGNRSGEVSSCLLADEPRSRRREEADPAAFRPAASSSQRLRFLVLGLSCLWLGPIDTPAQPASPNPGGPPGKVSFTNEIAPILLQKCMACHSPDKSKGGYQLHTFEAFSKGGKSKAPAIVPGQPGQSKLFELITTADEDDRMPQKDDPLPASQIGLIERWIKEGAHFDGPDPKAPLITLVPVAPHPDPPATYAQAVPITALAFSPGGQELALSGYHEITVWDPLEGKLLRRIKNVGQRTQSLDYSPDGALLAAASGTPGKLGEVKLLDPRQGATLKVVARTADLMFALCFSPDGARLAGGGADNTIHLWAIASGNEELRIEQHADWILGLAFSHDGSRIASASRDKSARVFNARTGEMEANYLGHADAVFSAAFGPDDKLVFTSGRDKKIHAWETKDAKKTGEIAGFDDDVLRILVTPEFIFSCSADKTVRQHQAAGKYDLVRQYAGHTDFVYSLAYDAATRRLAAGSFNGEVRVWNTGDGQLIASFRAAPGLAADQK